MKKYAFDIFNGIVILLGICALAECFEGCWNDCILNGVGIYGIYYLLYSGYLLVIQRVKFDWNLLQGNYICKVIALVLLTPFVLALSYQWRGLDDAKKALIYEENLYEKGDSVVDTERPSNFPKDLRDQQKDPSLFWTIYAHYIDPGNQHMTTTPEARIWVAVIAILGVFLVNGLLVSSIIGWIDIRKGKWLKGEVKYGWLLRMRSHYVIIGGNDMVAGIVKQLFEDSNIWKRFWKPFILIQTNRDVETFRRELFTGLTEDQQRRIIIYYGNRTSADDVADLKLQKAKEVYILGEDTRTDDIESYHDTMNMECLRLVSEAVKDVTKFKEDTIMGDNRLICRVMFEYQSTFNIFQVTDIDGEKIKFLPFNYYEMWAQKVLVRKELGENASYPYLPLEGIEGIHVDDEDFVHLVVVGMSRMGLALAIEAAHLAHYPNFENENKKRTRITFIDSNMKQEKDFFMGRFKEMFALARHRYVHDAFPGIYGNIWIFPWLDPLVDKKCNSPYFGGYLGTDFIDVEWEFVNGPIENPYIQQYLSDAASNPHAKLTIAVCLPENSRSIAAAAYLPDDVYRSKQTLQVLVYQPMSNELLRQINENKRYKRKLRAFGMYSEGYDSSLIELSEFIVKYVSDAYDEYQKNKVENRLLKCNSSCPVVGGCSLSNPAPVSPAVSVGKPKSARWWSNKYNIYTLWTKLRCMSVYSVKDFENHMMNILGRMEHNRWVVEQLLLRYRPLTEDEQANAKIVDICSSDVEKNRLKSEFAHLDICSNDKLNDVDYDISKLDQDLIKVLPKAYRDYLNKKKVKK